MALPKVIPTGLQSQMFWGSSSQCRTTRLGSPMWGPDPLLLGENLCNCNYSPICGSLTQGYGSGSPPLLPVLLWFLLYLFSCRRSLLLVFIGRCSINSCKFVVPRRGGELRFLLHHLGPGGACFSFFANKNINVYCLKK